MLLLVPAVLRQQRPHSLAHRLDAQAALQLQQGLSRAVQEAGR